MEPWDWLTIAALCASGAASPGPSLAVVLDNTIAGGRSQGLACAIGHGLGVGIYAFGAVVGFSAAIAAWPALQQALSIAGGLFLIYLGIQTGRRAPAAEDAPRKPGNRRGFRDGFLMAFLNPKIAVFFLALLGSFVPAESSFADRAGIAALAMGIDTAWYVFAALLLAGTGADRWLAARGRPVALVGAVLFVGVGIAVLAEAWLG